MLHLLLTASIAATPAALPALPESFTLSADSASVLTLDQALREAVADQPLLQVARHRRETAEALVTQAKSIEYPQVRADAQLIGASDNGLATAYLSTLDVPRVATRPTAYATDNALTPFVSSLAGIGAHYDVADFGYTRGTIGAASAQLDASVQNEQQFLQDLLLRVTTAYFGALAAQQTLAVNQDTLRRVHEHFEYAEAGVKSGLKPPVDLPLSQAQVQAARLAVIRSENNLAVARVGLDTAIGWRPAGEYHLVSPAPDERPVPDADPAMNQALSTRFDLAALRDYQRSTEFQGLVAYTGNLPRITATGSVNFRGFDSIPNAFNYDVGLVLDLPIFTGFLVRGQVQEMDARLAELKSQEDVLKQSIDYQLRQARATLLSAREAVVVSQAQVDAARASLDLAEGRYKNGLGNIVELTDAEALFDTAELGLLESRFDEAVSRSQLDYAIGQLKVP